jgi:hypothetical protein
VPVFSSANLASRAWAAATISSVRVARWASLGAVPLDVGLELGLELVEPLAGLAAPAGGFLLQLCGEAGPDVLVDARHDVEREVQDPLEIAGTDVEQDAEP